MFGVRRVVGGHAVDDAVGECPAQRLRIGLLAQRRIDPIYPVISGQPAVVEHQMVWCHLCGDRNPLLLSPFQDFDRPGGGGMADVDSRTGIPGEQRIARNDRLLGRTRPTRQAQPRGVGTFVRDRTGGESRFLGMLGNQDPQACGVFQRTPHHQGVGHTYPVV